MKNYTITVNGNVYDVTVEEGTGSAGAAAPVAKAAPKPAAAPAKPAAAASAGAGSVRIEAGAAGKVFKIIEAMKMEIPVVAPQDGTVASIDCAVGDPCAAGQLLATLN